MHSAKVGIILLEGGVPFDLGTDPVLQFFPINSRVGTVMIKGSVPVFAGVSVTAAISVATSERVMGYIPRVSIPRSSATMSAEITIIPCRTI